MAFRDKILCHFHRRAMAMKYIVVPQYILTKPNCDRLRQKHKHLKSLINKLRTFYGMSEINKR